MMTGGDDVVHRLRSRTVSDFQIDFDGATVWVNAPDGSCVGRFSRFGIDVHRTVAEQTATGEQCIECTHECPTPSEWDRFIELMRTHYTVQVPAVAKPKFLETAA